MGNIPEPKFISGYQYPFLGNRFVCGCEEPKEKTDCFFFADIQDMGAHIPTCNYHGKLGYCPCEGCGKYIAESAVAKGVRGYVDREKERREMRVSLFRGKRIDNGEWVEGNLLRLDSGVKSSPCEYDCYIVPMITNGSWRKYDFCLKFISPCFAVDPSTVCQYTGLTDKKGKNIWEGDIVKLDNIIGIVKHGKYQNPESDGYGGHVGFYVNWNDKRNLLRKDLVFWAEEGDFIGNIFDNPELVKDNA